MYTCNDFNVYSIPFLHLQIMMDIGRTLHLQIRYLVSSHFMEVGLPKINFDSIYSDVLTREKIRIAFLNA